MRTIVMGSLVVVSVVALLSWSRGPEAPSPTGSPVAVERPDRRPLPDGRYDVQSVSYDDASGQFRVLVLGAPAGVRPVLESAAVKMARLADDEVSRGTRARLDVRGGQPELYLAPDFQVAYTHNVVDERVDPGTGAREAVVVRQESSAWTPFMASMAGSMVANALFTPMYVVPPVYAPGGLSGVGAYGSTPAQAHQAFQQRTGQLPTPARLSASGAALKRLGPGTPALGSGVGSSKMKNSPASTPRVKGKSFGSFRRR